MIKAAEAQRDVTITLQLVPGQKNQAVAKQVDRQVTDAQKAATKAAAAEAKQRSKIERDEERQRVASAKQAERESIKAARAAQKEREAIAKEEAREREHDLKQKLKEIDQQKKEKIRAEKEAAKAATAEARRLEREQEMREKRAGKLLIRDLKAKERALKDEARMTRRYNEKIASDVEAATKAQVESKRRATEAGVGALQGAMDLAEGVAILGLVSDENFEKFAKGFIKVQAGFKAMKGLTELFWKGREALQALSESTKAQATANALLSSSNLRVASTQGVASAAGAAGAAGGGGAVAGLTGAAVATGGLALAATAAAAVLYELSAASTAAAEAEKQNAERLRKEKQQSDNDAKNLERRFFEGEERREENFARQAEQKRSVGNAQSLRDRVNYELGGGSQNPIEAANNERMLALREVQAAEQDYRDSEFTTRRNALRASERLEEANRNLIDAELRRLDVLREQKKAAEEQIKASKDAIKAAQDAQKTEQQRFASLSPGQQSRLKDLVQRRNAGEQLTERDVRLLERTGFGSDIVRDHRAQQGVAAGSDFVLQGLSSGFRDAREQEEKSRKELVEAQNLRNRAATGERQIKRTLPQLAQSQRDLVDDRIEKEEASVRSDRDRRERLRKLNEAESEPEPEQQEEQGGWFDWLSFGPSESPRRVNTNPFADQGGARQPGPPVRQDQRPPVRPPAQQAVSQVTDQVTQSGVEVEGALTTVLAAVVENNNRLKSEIENSELTKGYYNV